jgi:hypothetical protein
MELTQEFFEEKLKDLVTKEDLKDFAIKDDLKHVATKDDLKRFATKDNLKVLATKDDMNVLETRLGKKIDDQTDELARIIATTIAVPMQQGFEKLEQLVSVKQDVDTIKTALHLDQ